MENTLRNKTQLSDAMLFFLKPPLGLPTTCGHTTLPTTRPTTWQLVVGTGAHYIAQAHYIALIYSTQG